MEREYMQVPGASTHELPPLLVRGATADQLDDLVDRAAELVDAEDMLPSLDLDSELSERRKIDLAVSLADQYKRLLTQWTWGDSILEWVRQCEITFESIADLRTLLHPDLWPHANRSSFVTLLQDKSVPTHGVAVEDAVGLRLTFRQPPPLDCCSDQFLFLLNSPVAGAAYRTWARFSADKPALLPPDRFHFEVFQLD